LWANEIVTTGGDGPPRQGAPTAAAVGELALLINAGRHAELESHARLLLDRHPDAGVVWQLLGVALRMQGKDALAALQRATELLPDDAAAHNNLGNALGQLGHWEDAVTSYRRALALNPAFAPAYNNLGYVLRAIGRLDDAVASYQRALHINPDYAEAHHNLGDAWQALGRYDDAISSYRRALTLSPGFIEAHHNLGNAQLELGQLDDAAASYRRALALNPNFVEAHNSLGNALRSLGQLDGALTSYRTALALRPDFAAAHSNLAIALRLAGQGALAEASCRQALAIDPNLAATIAVLAELNADAGRFAEAEQLFTRAIAIAPATAEAWVGISRLRKMTSGDAAWAAQAQRIAGGSLPPRQEALLRYALGKYFDDLNDFDQAFDNYRRANQLTGRCRTRYDRQQMTQAVDLIIRTFDGAWLGRTRLDANSSARPVFIVGMMRSGTTLAEQILASHRSIHGAGELLFWNRAAAGGADSDMLPGLAADYLRLLQSLSAGALRVVDKMPGNFMHLGLIHAALPRAHIIHMRRNPIDTCLSIYFQHFEAFHPYATDLEDLAHYYGEYLRLMQHWRSILPAQSMLDLPYEGLVDDAELWSRKMVEFIGLPWDPQCSEFQHTRRDVITASKWQVRQAISRSSVQRWRNYERYIGPLRRLAGQ
jgi:tetratricopeptide (TPR) repeat protein